MKSCIPPTLPLVSKEMLSARRIRASLVLALVALLRLTSAHAANYYVDNAAQFNAATDKFGNSFSTLYAGDRVYLNGSGTNNWGNASGSPSQGLIATLTGSMTDTEAQGNPAIIYACDSNYNPTVGGVTVTGLSQIQLLGTGIVFTGVTFGSSSGMLKAGNYTDYDETSSSAYIIFLGNGSRYMTVSHCNFYYCGLNSTDPLNDHYGPWLYLNGYHHTVQYCEFQGRDFNPNDYLNPPASRTSIRDATVVIYLGSADTTNWGYHWFHHNYFGPRGVPLNNDPRLYEPAAGSAILTNCSITSGNATFTCAATSGSNLSYLLNNGDTNSGWTLSGSAGTCFPSGATILSVTGSTNVVMSVSATASAISVTGTASEPTSIFSNGWESIRNGSSSYVTTDFNNTFEYNVFYKSIYAVVSGTDDNNGEPEVISNKSRKNTYRYNTFLNSWGQLSIRQGDYCVVQGNYFLGTGAYDTNGNVVFTDPQNLRMGGVRIFGFGHTVANNYFYKLNSNQFGAALSLGEGAGDCGLPAHLNNPANGSGYETANYSQILGNTFIDCNEIDLDENQGGTNEVFNTQFINNLIYYSGSTVATGSSAIGVYAVNTDTITNPQRGGLARGNYIYSSAPSQFGSAVTILGTGSNTITSSANPLMTGAYDVLTVPAANSPVASMGAAFPAINDTSTTGESNYAGYLAAIVPAYGGLDMRGLSRPSPGTGSTIGNYELALSGTAGNRPMRRSEIGIVNATYPNYADGLVTETFSDGDRNTQLPPDSLAWFASTTNAVSVGSGTMTVTTGGNSSRQVVAYFPAQTLNNIGDSIVLSFNFSVTNPRNITKSLRAGLLYSGSNPPVTTGTHAQITSDVSPSNLDYTGYGSFINPVATATNNLLLARSGTGVIISAATATAWGTTLGSGTTQSLAAGTTYTATLRVTKTGADQALIESQYTGGSLSNTYVAATDPSGTYTTFDTLAFGLATVSGTAAVDSISYSNITLTKGSSLVATVALSGTSQAYDGTPKSVTATTNPTGLTVNLTYNGSPTPPTDAGYYTVVATIGNNNYSGSATGLLTITGWSSDWRNYYFGTTLNSGTAADTADPDHDGLTNVQEYAFGTNPTTPNTGNLLTIGNSSLSFYAIQADGSGPGYGGLTRYYTVQTTTDLTNSASWTAVPGYLNIPGTNQTVTVPISASAAKAFYRLQVSLSADSGVSTQTTATTAPVGYITLTASAGTGSTSSVSTLGLPLLATNGTSFTGQAAGIITAITTGTPSTITNTNAGWSAGALSGVSAPYLIQITSGSAAGLTFLISSSVANTGTTLTLDSTEPSLANLPAIATGTDTYAIFPADTISSVFGTGSTTGTNAALGGYPYANADIVQLFVSGAWRQYYYNVGGPTSPTNTNPNHWVRVGSNTVSDNVVIKPDAGVIYSRLANSPLNLTLAGSVPPVNRQTVLTYNATTGVSSGVTCLSNLFPVDTMTLGGTGATTSTGTATSAITTIPGWVTASSSTSADIVQLLVSGAWRQYWNNGTNWKRVGPGTVSDNVSIPAGSAIILNKKNAVSGVLILNQRLPYSLQ